MSNIRHCASKIIHEDFDVNSNTWKINEKILNAIDVLLCAIAIGLGIAFTLIAILDLLVDI